MQKKHRLVSIMQKISLYDELTIQITERKKIQITVTGKYKRGVANNSQNIIYKAAENFFSKYGFSFGIDICLEKNIPNGSGLGGGSSNAAEVIKFLHKEKNIPLVPSDYVNLGSDIPFFLENFSSGKLEGVGEKISLYKKSEAKFGILVFPHKIKISTKWAFEEYAKITRKKISNNSDNDFTPIMQNFFPEIEILLQRIQRFSPNKFGMSGSGSTLFGLFGTKKEQKNFLENFLLPGDQDEVIDFECL